VAPLFYFYAIVRYRLLEVRFIIRKVGLTLVALGIYSIAIALLFLLFRTISPSLWIMGTLTVIFLAPFFLFSPQLWRWLEHTSARIFFSGLYDPRTLEDLVSLRLTEQSEQIDGIFSALKEISNALGLSFLSIITLPGILEDESVLIGCYRDSKDTIRENILKTYSFPDWLTPLASKTLITEQLYREPASAEEKVAGINLKFAGAAASIPCMTKSKQLGCFLVGEKLSGDALSSTDVSFMEKVGLHFGLYLDNYALSTALLMKVNELEQANAFKEEVISLMAHEFRTPITIVGGVASLLTHQEHLLSPEQKAVCLEDLDMAVCSLVNLVEQAFQISEQQRGKLQPAISDVDLSILINKLLFHYPQEVRQRLVIDLPENGCVLPTDLNYLYIILRNIVDNAVKFSDEGSPIQISAVVEDSHLVFRVRDSGKGIPPEKIENIFDPFTRVESIEHHKKGAGLGLYIVKLYADQLGIKINVESTLGKGTTVILHCPLNTSKQS
jgi:anti-sigma regulatory factor (Ser/Thr protein kinase)